MKYALLALAAGALAAQDLPARRASNYNPNQRGGRFDFRARIDGSVDIYIRGGEIRYRVRNGAPPSDEGSEYSNELPTGEVMGFQFQQRDGRNPIRVVEEPNRRNNFTLVLAIDDPQGGAGRYHARISWDDSYGPNPFQRGSNRGGDGRRNDDFRSPDRWETEMNGGVPTWAVGLFSASTPQGDYNLEIAKGGKATLYAPGNKVNGEFKDGRLRLGGNRFDVARERDGVRVTHTEDGSVTVYRRVR